MADDAIFVSTARGEVRIATDRIIDPEFGPVHLIRTVGGAGGGSGMSLAEFQSELPLDVLQSGAWSVSISNFPASFGSVQSGVWNVGVNNFPAGFNVNNWPAVQPVNDNGGSITVDGVFWQGTQPVSLASLPTADGKTLTFISVNQGAPAATELAAASPGNRHKLMGCMLTMSADGTLKFHDTDADRTGPMDIAAKGGFVLPTSNLPFCRLLRSIRRLVLQLLVAQPEAVLSY